MRNRIIAFVAAALLVAAMGRAQVNMDSPAKPKAYVLYAAEPQSIPAGKAATLELRFHMVPGYHVNSHNPKSELLIATALTLQPAAGVKAGTIEYPAGHPYSFSFDPTEKLDVYMGDFTVKLPVVAGAGAHTVDGSLRYQACDNASCYPPRTLPVKVIFTAK
jgi:DsbC/DsbD-like thiol-disulfide interchange protein